MIKNTQEFIDTINEKILKKYDIQLNEIGEEDANVLAFFSPMTKEIFINKHSKYIFNDYIYFITTLQHENVHKINDEMGVQDVDIDENQKQWHNDNFKKVMLEKYKFYTCNEYGNINFLDKKNRDIFEEIVNESIVNKQVFNELQDYFFENIYEELEKGGVKKKDDNTDEKKKKDDEKEKDDERDNDDEKYFSDEDEFSFVEEDGIEF